MIQKIKKFTDHNHDKYITTPDFNKLSTDVFKARLAQANLITKTDFDAKLSSLSRKITKNKSKYLLVENDLKKLKTFDSSYFRGKSHFEEDGAQNYLALEPMYRYFKIIAGLGNGSHIYYCRSKGLTEEGVNSIKASNYYSTKIKVKFNGICFEEDKITYTHVKTVSIYTVYEISKSINISDYTTLEKCLFGAVILTKNTDTDRYKYPGYEIGFDGHGSFF